MFDALESYLGAPLTSSKIEARTDLVTVLVNEMIECTIPIQTDINMLQTVASLEGLFSKILSIGSDLANAALPSKPTRGPQKGITSGTSSPILDPEIPWRRPNVRHTNNLMYVDVEERINLILQAVPRKNKLVSLAKRFDSAFYSDTQPDGLGMALVPVTGTISGQINFNSQLSGVPHIQMYLKGARHLIDLPRLHRCIQMDLWTASPGTLSFVPPDGRSTLMEYTVDLAEHPSVGFVSIDYQQGVGTLEDEFEVRLYCREVKMVENLLVEMTRVGEDGLFVAQRVSHGDFTNKNDKVGVWNIQNVASGTPCTFRGSVGNRTNDDEESEPHFPVRLKISYMAKGAVPSGLKVESLKLVSAKGMSSSVKPYKGVKYLSTTGDYVVRTG